MDNLKATIAKNLVELRTKARLTQLQLAEMLNYSDKAVSKWERGEAIPDIRVLMQLSELYGVSIDNLVKDTEVAAEAKPKRRINSKRVFITVLSVNLVWFVATGIFAILFFITPITKYAWLVFIVAPLPTGIVLTVLSSMWGNRITNALSSSLILWSCAVIVHVYVKIFVPSYNKLFMLYIVAAVFELLIVLWFTYRWYISKKK